MMLKPSMKDPRGYYGKITLKEYHRIFSYRGIPEGLLYKKAPGSSIKDVLRVFNGIGSQLFFARASSGLLYSIEKDVELLEEEVSGSSMEKNPRYLQCKNKPSVLSEKEALKVFCGRKRP